MSGPTFNDWLQRSDDLAAKHSISGKYGVDFRTPEPTRAHQSALRLLKVVSQREAHMFQVNGQQFDYMEQCSPVSHSYMGGVSHSHLPTSYPKHEQMPQHMPLQVTCPPQVPDAHGFPAQPPTLEPHLSPEAWATNGLQNGLQTWISTASPTTPDTLSPATANSAVTPQELFFAAAPSQATWYHFGGHPHVKIEEYEEPRAWDVDRMEIQTTEMDEVKEEDMSECMSMGWVSEEQYASHMDQSPGDVWYQPRNGEIGHMRPPPINDRWK